MKDSIQNKENSKNSIILMILTFVSRLLGIIKARVITTAFGATSTADVINVAFYLPNNLRKIFAEGGITPALIPGLSKNKDKNYRNRLLSLLMSFQLIIFSIIILIFIFWGRQIFAFISDFKGSDLDLGAKLLPFFIVFLAFISIANIFASVLQTDQHFFALGIAPLFFSFVLILFVSFFHEKLDAMAMAYGVLIASFIQFLFTIIFVFTKGYKISLNFKFQDEAFKKILRTWIAVIGSAMATILAQQFSTYLASTLSTGNATAFSNSMIFFSTPYGIISTGIVTVVYPLLASSSSEKFKQTLEYGITGMINLFIPATILLMLLNREFVAVLLQNGKFTYQDTLLTASVIFYLVIGLTIIGLNSLLNRTLIATDKIKLAFILTILQAIIDVILSIVLIRKIGIIALPIANTISFFITLVIYFILLRENINFKNLFKTFFKTLIANIPLLVLLLIYKSNFTSWFISGSNLKNLIYLIVICLISGLVVLFSYNLFKIPFIEYFKAKK